MINLQLDLSLQMRSIARYKKEESEKRLQALRRGKHAAYSYGLLRKDDNILYNSWEEELKMDRRELEEKDLKLTEWILEATTLYQAIQKDDEKFTNFIII